MFVKLVKGKLGCVWGGCCTKQVLNYEADKEPILTKLVLKLEKYTQGYRSMYHPKFKHVFLGYGQNSILSQGNQFTSNLLNFPRLVCLPSKQTI